jgi:heme exporter protein A
MIIQENMTTVIEKHILKVEDISKHYAEDKYLFQNINLTLANGEVLGITGRNGTGKTTLLKIIAGILSPTDGKITLSIDDNDIPNVMNHTGYVAPYLSLWDEFTIMEHASILGRLRLGAFDKTYFLSLLEALNLQERTDHELWELSSGQRQRFRFAMAFLIKPTILMLDEPFTNLDEPGIEAVKVLIQQHTDSGGSVIIATNSKIEAALCGKTVKIGK